MFFSAPDAKRFRENKADESNHHHYVNRSKASGLPAKFIPSEEWQAEQVANFSDLRLRLERHSARIYQEEASNPEKKKSLKKPKFPQREDERGKN